MPVASLVDLGIERLQWWSVAVEVQRCRGRRGRGWRALGVLWEVVGVAVGIAAAAVHGRAQRADAGVGVLLVRAEGAADDVLDLGVLPVLHLLLPELLGFGLYSEPMAGDATLKSLKSRLLIHPTDYQRKKKHQKLQFQEPYTVKCGIIVEP